MPTTSILLIDDDTRIHAMVANALKSASAALTCVSNGEDALDALAERAFDVIVCDRRLPGMCGLETLTRSRGLCPSAIRIVFTGETDLVSAVRAVNEGRVSRFLLKPLERDQLHEALQDAIETALARRTSHESVEKLQTERDSLRHWTDHLESVVHSRTNDLMNAYDETLNALVMALDAREQATAGHSRRVAVLTLYLAVCAGIDHDELENIYRGALLHDFGKIGIPDAILLKPARLEHYEREAIERHPALGDDLIRNIGYLRHAREIVRSHHEKFDGSGYPDGLTGGEIPIGARLFAIVDVYDALRSARPYKPAMDHDEACDQIRQAVGSHFDPIVAELFFAVSRASLEELGDSAMTADTFTKAMALCGRYIHAESDRASAA
ncbi:MAG: HD domain-containing phosphohydrolase [Phycisphaerales bacterium]